ncbi:mucin-binding protein [Lactovum odontotermitis]
MAQNMERKGYTMSYQHQKKKLLDNSNTHYRTWKKGKSWCYSFSVLAALAGGVVLASQTVNADTSAVTTTDTSAEVPELTPENTETSAEIPAVTSEITQASDAKTSEGSETAPVDESATPGLETETANTGETSQTSASDSVVPAATAAKLEAPLPASTSYNFTDLEAKGIISNVKVTWNVADGTEIDLNTQAPEVHPTSVSFTINSNDTLQPGDTIDFGNYVYEGYFTANHAFRGSELPLSYGTWDPATTTFTLSDSYNQDLAVAPNLELDSATPRTLHPDEPPFFTASWLGDKITVNVIPEKEPGDATVFPDFQSDIGGYTSSGALYLTSKTWNSKYNASLLDGSNPNYDASVGGTPDGNYVTIWHIDAESAKNITSIEMNNAGNYGPALNSAGTALRRVKESSQLPPDHGGGPQTYYYDLSSLPADSTDSYITNNSEPKTYGIIKNNDGSLTIYYNDGNLQDKKPATANQVATMPFNNNPEGVEAATPVFTNPNYSMSTSYTAGQFKLNFVDPTVSYDVNMTTGQYSTGGYSREDDIQFTTSPTSGASVGQSTIKVHYQDENGNPLVNPSTALATDSHYGWPTGNTQSEEATPDLSITAPDIPGYTYKSVDASNAGSDGSASVSWPAEGTTTDVIYTYSANPQSIIVKFIDDDDSSNTPLPNEILDGVTGETSTYTTADDIADLKNQGYVLVEDQTGGANLTFGTTSPTTYEVHLKHDTASAEDSSEVTRTIHYVVKGGPAAAPDDMPQTVTFTRTGTTDLVKEKAGDEDATTWNDWTPASDTFDAVDSPVLENYTPDLPTVDAVPLTPDSVGKDVTVTYSADTTADSGSQEVTRTIHYVYDADDSEAAEDVVQTVTFTRTGTKNLATGVTTWDKWTSADSTFDKTASPVIPGFTPDQTSVAEAAASADETIPDVTVRYKADAQKIVYTVIDDTADENLEENVGFDEGSTNDACTRGQEDLQGIADDYKDKGYDIVSVDTLPESFDADTAKDQIVYIHLSHATEDSQESKEVNETIHYVYEDGTEAAPDKTDKVTFTRMNTTDKVTGEVIASTDWIAENDDTTFDAVTSPEIDGYTADKSTVEAITGLTADSEDTKVTVTYTKDAEDPAPTTSSSTPKATISVQPTSQTAKKVLPSTGDEKQSTVAAAGGLIVLGAGLLGMIRHLRRKKQ